MNPKHILAKAALAVAVAAVSFTAVASHSWGGYHWGSTTSPFTLQVLDSTVSNSNANWPALLSTAVSEWSQSSKLDFNKVPYDNSSQGRRKCSAVSGKIRVCNQSYGNNGWLGLASINLSGSHITQATAKMNDSYTSTWTGDPNEARHVMCQEVGHDFGLDHQSTDGSSQATCMDYSSSPSSISPNAHDYDELVIIYNHTDSSNTHAFRATPSQSAMTGNIPMGVLVRKDHFSEMYVAPDGRGGLWVHHVFLAPGFEHIDAQ